MASTRAPQHSCRIRYQASQRHPSLHSTHMASRRMHLTCTDRSRILVCVSNFDRVMRCPDRHAHARAHTHKHTYTSIARLSNKMSCTECMTKKECQPLVWLCPSAPLHALLPSTLSTVLAHRTHARCSHKQHSSSHLHVVPAQPRPPVCCQASNAPATPRRASCHHPAATTCSHHWASGNLSAAHGHCCPVKPPATRSHATRSPASAPHAGPSPPPPRHPAPPPPDPASPPPCLPRPRLLSISPSLPLSPLRWGCACAGGWPQSRPACPGPALRQTRRCSP